MAIKAFSPVDVDDPDGSVRIKRVNLGVATGAGGLAAIKNPFGERAIILEAILDVTTPATGAATADIGVAANATTSSDTMFDGKDIGTAAILASYIVDGVATAGNEVYPQAIGATAYVTATASADPAGLVGTLQVIFVKVAAVA